MVLRQAQEADVAHILRLIRDLAEYERLPHEVIATEEALRRTLFGPRPYVEALLAEVGGSVVGFALYFHNYSTFLAKPGLYVEDVYVQPEYRGQGIGSALFQQLARLAVERGCGRMEWSVLNWNEPSIRFYRGLGAVPLSDWTVQRLTGAALTNLAERSDESAPEILP